MKKTLVFVALAFLAACDGNSVATNPDSTKPKMDSAVVNRSINSPYPVMYSSSFAIDDPKNAETVLNFWKAYDNGTLGSAKDAFADSFEVHLAEGVTMKLSRDSTIGAVQSYRNMFASVTSTVTAVMAVKSTDKGEHWVLIWGMEKDTHKNGKSDSVDLQETWRFNASGKADVMYQYALHPPKK